MITRFLPEEMVDLDRPFTDLFRTLSGPWPVHPLLPFMPAKGFIPAANVFEHKGDLVLRLDLPGMDAKDIHVSVEEGDLIVMGERKESKEVKEEGYYRKESSYGAFERHMTLPKGVKESDIKAEYESGVLEIVIPNVAKANGGKPKATLIPILDKEIKPIKV